MGLANIVEYCSKVYTAIYKRARILRANCMIKKLFYQIITLNKPLLEQGYTKLLHDIGKHYKNQHGEY